MSNVTLSVWKKKLEMQVKHFFHQGTNCKLSMKIRNRLPHLVFFMPKIPFPGAWPQFRTMVPIWFSHRCGVCAVSLQYLSKVLFRAFLTMCLFPFQCLIFHQIIFPLFKKHHQKIDEQVSIFQTSPYFFLFLNQADFLSFLLSSWFWSIEMPPCGCEVQYRAS